MYYLLLFRGDTNYTKASRCYVKHTLPVLSLDAVNVDSKKTSKALGMRHRPAQRRSLCTTLQSERKTSSATSSQNIFPCCSTGRTRRTASRIQVGSITEWVSLLGHKYIFRMHTYVCVYTYIHVHKQIHSHACMHTYIIHTYHTYEGSP